MYYLGTISGSSGACYNNVTGVSGLGAFTIPKTTKSIYLFPSASGLQWGMNMATGVTSFLTDRNAAQLIANQLNGPFKVVQGEQVTVGIYNTSFTANGYISCRVYSAPTS